MTPDALARLSTLLDEALELDPAAREAWLATLDGEALELAPTLRKLLARQATKETADLLERGPSFTLPTGTDAPAASFHPGDTVGPYRLLRALGHGGMGEVWQAERADGTLKRKVALKLPHVTWAPGHAERFSREREILSSLEHPHIARLYDAGLDPHGRPYMALEYVEGLPIDEYCKQRALPIEGRLRLLLQVADAVAFAHSRLVIHRDLKPGNILVTDDGQVRLLDFGIAKLMEGDTTRETALTRVGGRALTLDYASPEQIRGEPIGTPSDVYSLAVVAFELLAGARPYRLKRGSAAELEEAIAGQDLPLASSLAQEPATRKALSGDLDAILNKALKKSVTERYLTVDALAQDWRSHLAGQRVHARPDSIYYRMLRFARRQRMPLVAGGAAVAVLGVALGFGATALVILVLLLGLVVAMWQARRAREQARRAGVEGRKAEAVTRFLLDLFRTNTADQPDPERARQTTARELLDLGAAKLSTALADQPASRLILAESLSELYAELGLWPEASRLGAEQLALARQLHGPTDPRVAAALVACAHALDKRERDSATEVMPLLNEALQILDANDDHDSALRGRLHVLAADHLLSHSLADARPHAEHAVAIFRGRHATDPAHDDALETLALVLIRQGEHAAAAEYIGQALALAREQRRSEFRIAPLLRRAGEIHAFAGNFEVADPLLREALAAAEHVHGEHNAATVSVRLSLARYLSLTGRMAEARTLADRALSDATVPTGNREPYQIQETRRLVFEVYFNQGDLAACRSLIAQAFADFGLAAGDSFEHADHLLNRAMVETEDGEFARARATLEKACAMADRVGMGPGSLLDHFLRVQDIELRMAVGDANGALNSIELMEAAGGRPPSASQRARTLAAAGRTDEARGVVDEALHELESAADRVWRADVEANLQLVSGGLYLDAGDLRAALPALGCSVDLYRQIHVPASPSRKQAEAALETCLARLANADKDQVLR